MSDTLSIIIVILIIAIVLDGLRRARNARRKEIRLSKNARKADKVLETEIKNVNSSEFPSGGARRRGSLETFDQDSVSPAPRQASLDLDEPVPMLMDSVESVEAEQVDELERDTQLEPSLGSLDNLDHIEPAVAPAVEDRHDDPAPLASEKKSRLQFAADLFGRDQRQDEGEDPSASTTEAEEIVVINLMSKPDQYFDGASLLTALTEAKLRFGQMGIFHRHVDNDGDAASIFSVANIVEPGVFDLSSMHSIQTPGLCMFLALPSPIAAVDAYENLIHTAQELAQSLNGEIKDENRSALTNQTIEHGRQRVLEFERKYKLHTHR